MPFVVGESLENFSLQPLFFPKHLFIEHLPRVRYCDRERGEKRYYRTGKEKNNISCEVTQNMKVIIFTDANIYSPNAKMLT